MTASVAPAALEMAPWHSGQANRQGAASAAGSAAAKRGAEETPELRRRRGVERTVSIKNKVAMERLVAIMIIATHYYCNYRKTLHNTWRGICLL